MKWIIWLLFPFTANAACHLTSNLDQNGDLVMMCTKGFTPLKTICKNVPRPEMGGGKVFEVDVITQSNNILSRALDAVGLGRRRSWDKKSGLSVGERFQCYINKDKVNALKAEEKAKEAQQKAKFKDARESWAAACQSNEIHKLICMEKGIPTKGE